jgi:hypothetical protein
MRVTHISSFNAKARKLLRELAKQASESPKMYKSGRLRIGEGMTINGLAQCSRDLIGSDCKQCLDDEVRQQPDCCDGKQGGSVVSGSCNIRYDACFPVFQCLIWGDTCRAGSINIGALGENLKLGLKKFFFK